MGSLLLCIGNIKIAGSLFSPSLLSDSIDRSDILYLSTTSNCALLDVDLGGETDSPRTVGNGYGIRYGRMCGSKSFRIFLTAPAD